MPARGYCALGAPSDGRPAPRLPPGLPFKILPLTPPLICDVVISTVNHDMKKRDRREHNKAYRKAHPEYHRQKSREHYRKNRDEQLARSKARYREDPERARAIGRAWRARNRDRINEKRAQQRANPVYRAAHKAEVRAWLIATWEPRYLIRKLQAAKTRAKTAGIEFNITIEDISPAPDACPVLGIPLIISPRAPHNNVPSIDRMDNTKGYVKGNVRLISNRANTLKSDMSLAEARRLLAYMETVALIG